MIHGNRMNKTEWTVCLAHPLDLHKWLCLSLCFYPLAMDILLSLELSKQQRIKTIVYMNEVSCFILIVTDINIIKFYLGFICKKNAPALTLHCIWCLLASANLLSSYEPDVNSFSKQGASGNEYCRFGCISLLNVFFSVASVKKILKLSIHSHLTYMLPLHTD